LEHNSLWKNYMKQWVYKLLLFHYFTFNLAENQYKQRFSWSLKTHTTKLLYGEPSIRWTNFTAKFLYGEISVRWNFLRRKFVTVKFRYGEISLQRNFLTAKFPSAIWSIAFSGNRCRFDTAVTIEVRHARFFYQYSFMGPVL